MVKLADTQDLDSCALRRAGSNPAIRTIEDPLWVKLSRWARVVAELLMGGSLKIKRVRVPVVYFFAPRCTKSNKYARYNVSTQKQYAKQEQREAQL